MAEFGIRRFFGKAIYCRDFSCVLSKRVRKWLTITSRIEGNNWTELYVYFFYIIALQYWWDALTHYLHILDLHLNWKSLEPMKQVCVWSAGDDRNYFYIVLHFVRFVHQSVAFVSSRVYICYNCAASAQQSQIIFYSTCCAFMQISMISKLSPCLWDQHL